MPYCPIHTTIALEAKRRGWYCEECGNNVLTFDQFPLPMAAPALPPLISGPFEAMAAEKHSFVWLWTACEAVEALLKFLAVASIAERSAGGVLPEALASEIQSRIDRPSMGQWAHMLRVLASAQPESKLLPELKAVFQQIEEMLTGVAPGDRNPATSFLALRNQLAHGGIGSRHEELRAHWEPVLAKLRESLAPLAELQIIVQGEDGAWLTMKPEGLVPFTRPELMFGKTLSPLYAVRGETVVPFWPLGLFGAPVGLDDCPGVQPALQLYLRRDKEDLHYLPLQVDTPMLSKSSRQALEAFHSLFPAKPPRKAKVAGFEDEIRKDADERVGRDAELQQLRDWVVRPNPEQKSRSLWIAGIAGMGKSVLVASLVQELQKERKNVLAYRFRSGDPRCNWASFCTFLDERLSRPDPEPFSVNQRDQAKDRIRERVYRASSREPLTLVLDGIDEVHRSDAEFVRHFLKPLADVDGLTLICAGRPDEGLPEMFHHLPAEFAFDGGLPPLAADQVKAILLERLERRGLRKRLIEQGSQDSDAFVGAVTRNAAGLPIYVRYAVNDVLGGKLRVLDAQDARALPPSLNEYYQRIVRDYGLGTDAQIRLEIFYLLAVACCPLNAATLAEFCVRLKTIGGELAEPPEERVRRAISALSPMLRMSLVDGEAPSYALYHDSFRQHLATHAATRDSVAGMHHRLGALAMQWKRGDSGMNAGYLVRYGLEHLLAAGDHVGAESLSTNIPYMATLRRMCGNFIEPWRYWRALDASSCVRRLAETLHRDGDFDADDLNSMGTFLKECGIPDTARSCFEKSVTVSTSQYGPKAKSTLTAVERLAEFLYETDQYDEAERLYRQILTPFEEAFGSRSHEAWSVRTMLSIVLTMKGDHDSRIDHRRETVKQDIAQFGIWSERVIESLRSYLIALKEARLEASMGDVFPTLLRDLRERWQSIVFSTDRWSSEDQSMTRRLTVLLMEAGDHSGAQFVMQAMLERLESLRVPNHPEVLDAQQQLGNVLGERGDYPGAKALLSKALEGCKSVYGDGHRSTQFARRDLAYLFRDHGYRSDFQRLMKEYHVFCIEEEKARLLQLEADYGVGHPNTMKAVRSIGELMEGLEDYAGAVAMARRCFTSCRTNLGPGHPDTLDTVIRLGSLLERINDLKEARKLYVETVKPSNFRGMRMYQDQNAEKLRVIRSRISRIPDDTA